MSPQRIYHYECAACGWRGPDQSAENEAWGDGVGHNNEHPGHEHGAVGWDIPGQISNDPPLAPDPPGWSAEHAGDD